MAQDVSINIRRRIFKEDPAVRFARVFKHPADLWRETWRRYKILDYSDEEAREYLMMVTKSHISRKKFIRWIRRTEIYNKAQVAVQIGAKDVKPQFFGELQPFVEQELSRNKKV